LDHPALFKTFADTPQSPEGIAAFANRYGFLGFAEMVGSVSATRSDHHADPGDARRQLRIGDPAVE
jgi:hypothetical protein